MENYIVEPSGNTLAVSLDADNHHFKFEGDSRPEDVPVFFDPIMNWLENYAEHLKMTGEEVKILCDFELEYFNSSSAKYIMDIFHWLSVTNSENPKIHLTINWHHEEIDEDMIEAGKEFEEIVNIPFNYIAIE